MYNFTQIKKAIELGDTLRDQQKIIEDVQHDSDIKDSSVRGIMFGCNVLRSAISGMYTSEIANFKCQKGMDIIRNYIEVEND